MKNIQNTISGRILPREFYLQPTLEAARGLIGCCLAVADSAQTLAAHVSEDGRIAFSSDEIPCGRIVETEAYLGFADSAAHSYNKRPGGRTNIMFGEGGHAYIYLIYGMYYCLNAVTRREGEPEGVLIRALQPLFAADKKACSGPGKLCRTLGITREDYGCDLTGGGRLAIFRPDNYASPKIGVSARIGVENSGEGAALPYRFFDRSSAAVSGSRKQNISLTD